MSENCRPVDDLLDGMRPGELREVRTRLAELPDVGPCIARGLARAWQARDLVAVSHRVWVADVRPSPETVPLLVEILRARPDDFQLEDVVEALEVVKDARAVPVLVEALAWELEVDDYRQFNRKCLWALRAIGTPEALAAVRQTALTAAEPLRGYAVEELAGLDGGAPA